MEATTQQLPTVVLHQPKPGFKHNPEWETTEDIGSVVGEPTLGLDEFLKDGESYVVGTTMVERAKVLGNLAGQSHAERLLDNQQDIPVEWRQFVLVFAGTIRRCPSDNDLYVACLYGSDDGRGWVLGFGWLDGRFDGRYRLVRLGK